MSADGGGRITVSVHTTTGGRMQLELQPQCSVASLKRTLSARLRLAKDRIVLLHRNRQLKDGTLDSNNVRDGERLTLLPSVETGLQTVRPEQSVMQALESLSDAQVDNFLCGRAPLHLTMRLGDHVMFVQLQLCPPADTPPVTPTTPGCPAPPQPAPPAAPTESLPGAGGAVIDHLRHLGQGVYSGSFSGTLGPELQDGDGRPRRHVATILHILRDLLGASQGWKGAGPSPAPRQATPPATPPTSPPPEEPPLRRQEEHRLLRGKLDQIRATLRERRRARRRPQPYPTPTGSSASSASDGPVPV